MNWPRLGRLPLLVWLLCVCLVAVPGSVRSAWAQDPVTWSAKLAPSALRAGETGRIQLSAKIGGSWHIYAPTTPPGGPIATKITLVPNAIATQVGTKIAQPKPLRQKDEGFGIFIETFSKAVTFGIPVKLKPSAKSGTMQVRVRYQVCNEKLCLPPKDAVISVPVKVEAGARRAAFSGADTPVTSSIAAAAPNTATGAGAQQIGRAHV